MMKKLLVSVLVLSLLMSITSGCSASNSTTSTTKAESTTENESSENEQTDPEEELVVGIVTTSISSPTFDAGVLAQKTTIEAAGGKVVESIWDFTSDGTVTAVEELIQKGANAVSFIPVDESILPKISRVCEEAQCYFSLSCRYIADDDIRAELEANPYFAGICKEDEEQAAYDMVAKLHNDKGVKQIALISQPTGDQVTDGRDAGIQRACEEFDIELVAEVRNVSAASDATKAVESFFASYPDLDGIVYGGSTVSGAVAAILTGFDNAGMTGKAYLVGWDFDDTMKAGFDSETIVSFAGGHLTTDPVVALSIAINAAKGTPLSNEGPVYLDLPLMMVESWTDIEDYLDTVILNENVPYNSEELKSNFFKFENSEVSAESLQSYIGKWSLDDVKARRQGE